MTWLPAARKVLADHQAAYLDPESGEVLDARDVGVLLDVQTANVLVSVHDALSETNAFRLAAMPVVRATQVAWNMAYPKEN